MEIRSKEEFIRLALEDNLGILKREELSKFFSPTESAINPIFRNTKVGRDSYPEKNKFYKLFDKELNFYIPIYAIEPEKPTKTIFYCSGNAVPDLDLIDILNELAEHYPNFRIVTFPYPGKGLNTLKNSLENVYKCSHAVYDAAKSHYNIKNEDIFLYGASLGTHVITELLVYNKNPKKDTTKNAGAFFDSPFNTPGGAIKKMTGSNTLSGIANLVAGDTGNSKKLIEKNPEAFKDLNIEVVCDPKDEITGFSTAQNFAKLLKTECKEISTTRPTNKKHAYSDEIHFDFFNDATQSIANLDVHKQPSRKPSNSSAATIVKNFSLEKPGGLAANNLGQPISPPKDNKNPNNFKPPQVDNPIITAIKTAIPKDMNADLLKIMHKFAVEHDGFSSYVITLIRQYAAENNIDKLEVKNIESNWANLDKNTHKLGKKNLAEFISESDQFIIKYFGNKGATIDTENLAKLKQISADIQLQLKKANTFTERTEDLKEEVKAELVANPKDYTNGIAGRRLKAISEADFAQALASR